MQDPSREIAGVVGSLVEAKDATEQLLAVKRYFTPDASFDHALCSVASRNGSRDLGLLQVYQWLRVMSNSSIVVHSSAFDKEKNELFLDMTQTLRPTILPFLARPARIVTVLFLRVGDDGLYYVSRQEDYYQPQILPFGIIPGGEQVVVFIKNLIGFNCFILAIIFGIFFGFWRPSKGVKSR
ncbi:hypothetical protein CBS101457_005469 [Exobasidium rhododendri]|nr:hypothetical protein CBS101457_005469 [Exobasidium rhododendri]